MPAKKKPGRRASAAGESVKDLSESLPKGREGGGKRAASAKKPPDSVKESPAEFRMPGSVRDERRCKAKAHRTGERCKAPAMIGQTTCRVHGGAAPQNIKSAKERLLALVDPALAALDQVLQSKDADDAHKVRAALGILDRTGFRPGMDVSVHGPTLWEQLSDDAVIDRSFTDPNEDDRSLPSSNHPAIPAPGGDHTGTWEDADTFQRTAQADAWAPLDDEDADEYERGRIRPNENTVPGEVVNGTILPEPSPPPTDEGDDPPIYGTRRARRG